MTMPQEYVNALMGGAVIGVAATLMLIFNGRVTGISGILGGALNPTAAVSWRDYSWRFLFIAGLVGGGFLLQEFYPEAFLGRLASKDWTLILAGLLVGYGTQLGSGCTSGHGVCGISRLSIRSLVATVTFIASGVLFIVLYRFLGVLA